MAALNASPLPFVGDVSLWFNMVWVCDFSMQCSSIVNTLGSRCLTLRCSSPSRTALHYAVMGGTNDQGSMLLSIMGADRGTLEQQVRGRDGSKILLSVPFGCCCVACILTSRVARW